MARVNRNSIWLSLLLSGGIAAGATPDTRIAEAVQNRDAATVRTLIAQHAAVNTVQADGMTALIWAAHNDDVEMARLLIGAGANARVANRYGVTPLTEAALLGDAPLVELLLKAGADANTALPEGDTALMLASKTGSAEAVKSLLDHGAIVTAKEGWHGETALMSAAGENHPDIIKLLVEHGADVNAQGTKLDYPLIVRQDVMSLPPVGGLTPLMDAARENSYEAAQALLKAGADPNRQSPEKMTALLIAVTNLHWDVAKLLIDNGANVNDGSVAQVEQMRNLKTTLSRPVSKGPHSLTSMDVMKALLEKGAKPDSVIPGEVPTRSGGPGRGGDVPALVRASKTADIEVMRVLLDHNADPKAAGKDGQNALIAAVGQGGRGGGGGFGIGSKGATDEERIAAMKLVLAHGADVNAGDNTGQTPLHAAAAKGSDEIVQFLADNGAKLDAKDKRDHTALDVANGKGGGGGRGGAIAPTEPVVHETTVALLRKLMGLPPEEKKEVKKEEGEAPSADGNNNQ